MWRFMTCIVKVTGPKKPSALIQHIHLCYVSSGKSWRRGNHLQCDLWKKHIIHHTCIRYFIPQRGEINAVSNTSPHESIPISMTDGCWSRQILWAQCLRMFYWHWTAWNTAMMWRDEINTSHMGPIWAHLGPVGPRWAPCRPHEYCYQGYYGSLSTHGLFIIFTKKSMRKSNQY